MRLRTEALLDVIEKPDKPSKEIQFRWVLTSFTGDPLPTPPAMTAFPPARRLVRGDVEQLQGKWIVTDERRALSEQLLGRPLEEVLGAPASGSMGQDDSQATGSAELPPAPSGCGWTLVKYAVEMRVGRAGAWGAVLIEPLLERLVYEDLPANIAAIKTRIERTRVLRAAQDAAQRGSASRAVSNLLDRGGVSQAEMAADLGLLRAELARAFGEGRMPTRQDTVCASCGRSAGRAIHLPTP